MWGQGEKRRVSGVNCSGRDTQIAMQAVADVPVVTPHADGYMEVEGKFAKENRQLWGGG